MSSALTTDMNANSFAAVMPAGCNYGQTHRPAGRSALAKGSMR
jgi:hypothetical protein